MKDILHSLGIDITFSAAGFLGSAIMFYNKKKKNLTYLFLFFSVFISFFDKLYHDELDHKQKNKEMLIDFMR